MKGAPHFKAWPDSVDGLWKFSFLRWLGAVCDIDVLVETGTCSGSTPVALNMDFEDIYTVELDLTRYEESRRRLLTYHNVQLWQGDSRERLPMMIALAQDGHRKILFWLDAHASGSHTAQDNPLSDELKIIMQLCPDALIVIDDQMNGDFIDGEGRYILDDDVDLTGWHHEYRTGEVLMYKEGRYSIPPFD
jgi:hypothetical protein